MARLPEDTLERLTELAPTAFYALMGISLLAAVLGATGFALVVLILGGVTHVARVGLEAL